MTDTPLISVLMPVFNGASHLRPTLRSILEQTNPNFELLVTDDGSQDGTWQILGEFAAADARVQAFRNEHNLGVPQTMNRLFGLARGVYVTRHDADDLSRPERLARQTSYLNDHPAIGVLGTQAQFIDADGRPLDRQDFPPKFNNDELQAELLSDNCLCQGSVMFRRSLLDQVGHYELSNIGSEDYDLWLRLAEVTQLAVLPEILYDYRVLPGSLSHRRRHQQAFHAALSLEHALERRFGSAAPAEQRAAVAHHYLRAAVAACLVGDLAAGRDDATRAGQIYPQVWANPASLTEQFLPQIMGAGTPQAALGCVQTLFADCLPHTAALRRLRSRWLAEIHMQIVFRDEKNLPAAERRRHLLAGDQTSASLAAQSGRAGAAAQTVAGECSGLLMRIGIVVPELVAFGGLEKIAVETAAALRQQGQQVCVVSIGSAPSDNQYRVFLRRQGIPFFQSPRWLYLTAADWPTKQRLLAWALAIGWPLTAAAALLLMLLRRQSPARAFASARGWLSNQLLRRLLVPFGPQRLARLLLGWWQWRWRPEVLHLHGFASALMAVLDWAATRRLPVVYTEHSTPEPRFEGWQAFARGINKATVIVAVSDKSAQALRAIGDVQRPLLTSVPAVVDPLSEGHPIALPARPAGGPLNVTTVARLSTAKGLNYLLEGIAQVQPQFPATRFRIHGEGPQRDELVQQAARLGLNGAEIFAGAFNHAELPGIMAETDIFVMSSVSEGLPLALVEAMAYGRPIVATTVGGNAEVIADGLSGLLCPPRDAACLGRQLACLLADAALRGRLGQAARQAYEQGGFTPQAVAQHHLLIYQQALHLAAQPA